MCASCRYYRFLLVLLCRRQSHAVGSSVRPRFIPNLRLVHIRSLPAKWLTVALMINAHVLPIRNSQDSPPS